MKQLAALLCTIVLTFTLCVSLAHAESVFLKPALLITDNSNTKYGYNKNSAGLFYLNSFPKLTPITLDINSDTFGFSPENVINERNYFFEFSIIFNDKLQQLIAFFTRNDSNFDVHNSADNNSFSAKTSIQKCADSK